MTEPRLKLEKITRTFPGVKALDGVSFDLAPGEVHALVGENGAGKSTLIKILGGLFPQDSGRILLEGRERRFRNAHHSQESGISVIHQEFDLFPELSVAENIFVSREFLRGIFLDWRAMSRATVDLLDRLNVSIPPMKAVEDLSVAEKQMVEIAKALSFNARLIVMDEPTAALSDREVESLFAVTRALRDQGTTVLFVSHRLKEVFAIADRITVLRDGKVVATRDARESDEREITRLMVGRDIAGYFSKDAAYSNEMVLTVRGLGISGELEDISFDLRRGEILGVAGLMGCGRRQLVEALYGLQPIDRGEVLLEGRPVVLPDPKRAIARGIGFLAEERKSHGIFPEMSVLHNATISILRWLTRWAGTRISFAQERACLSRYADRLNIRCRDEHQQIQYLSGGNQQKVLLARALAADCKVLILCEPTRGVDVGAKGEIHALMNQLAAKGVAMLMISSELPEVINMSDSVMVMHEGRIAGRLSDDEMTETNIIACATGHTTIGVG